MKYTSQVIIDKPIEEVVTLFSNPENMKEWQPGFVHMENISGTPNENGAISELTYHMGKRTVVMKETIVNNNLPEELSVIFEAPNVYNVQRNSFMSISEDKTKYISENEFRFSGVMKLFGWLMPGQFKKQTQKYLDLFKEFAERQ